MSVYERPRNTKIEGSNLRAVEAVTPTDDTDLPLITAGTYTAATALYVGTTGNVIVTVAGTDVTFTALAAGVWHPMPPYTQVQATGTTASNLVAGY